VGTTMRWRILLTVVLVSVCRLACATGQQAELITVDGIEHDLNTLPLEPYLTAHPEQRPRSSITSSGLWRGYVGHWAIVDGRLTLTRIEVIANIDENVGPRMKDVTRLHFPTAPVVADWYSGALIVPRGELVNYVHMGFASTYEAYTVLIVKGGTVLKRDDLSLAQFLSYKRQKFQAFKKTTTYAREFARAKKDFHNAAMAEEFLSEIFAEQYLSVINGTNE
jgi:hypothetical protein